MSDANTGAVQFCFTALALGVVWLMDEHTEKLQSLLRQLHVELESVEELDEDARARLKNAAKDIDAVLGPDESDQGPQQVADRLSHFATEFESTHPNLSGLLARIVTGLSEIGI